MAKHIPSRDLGDVVVDDPVEVERINRLEASANVSLNVAAKRVLQHALALSRSR